jgi:hypothetical protein
MRFKTYATLLVLCLAVIAGEAMAGKFHSPKSAKALRHVQTIELSPDARLIGVYPDDELALRALVEERPRRARLRSEK